MLNISLAKRLSRGVLMAGAAAVAFAMVSPASAQTAIVGTTATTDTSVGSG